jgi:hypothetical protein
MIDGEPPTSKMRSPANRGFPRPGNNGFGIAREEWYVEPRWCVHQFLDYLDFIGEPIIGEVLDPACGTIVSVCRERGIPARGSDYIDRGFGEVRDLFDLTEQVDNIITNVPYSKAEPCVRKLITLVRRKLIMILPLTFWESQRRHRGLHREIPPKFFYPCGDRPSMPPGVDTGSRDAFGAIVQPVNVGGKAPYAWYEYWRGFQGQTIVRIMNPRKDAA